MTIRPAPRSQGGWPHPGVVGLLGRVADGPGGALSHGDDRGSATPLRPRDSVGPERATADADEMRGPATTKQTQTAQHSSGSSGKLTPVGRFGRVQSRIIDAERTDRPRPCTCPSNRTVTRFCALPQPQPAPCSSCTTSCPRCQALVVLTLFGRHRSPRQNLFERLAIGRDTLQPPSADLLPHGFDAAAQGFVAGAEVGVLLLQDLHHSGE